MKYLKVWTNFRQVISMLDDAEKGRLFDAMLQYAEDGTERELTGNERIVWPGAKQGIDLTANRNETLRNNGSKGGRPTEKSGKETKQNQTKPNRTKENQGEPNKTKPNQTEPNQDFSDDGGYLFGLTDQDIHATLEMDRQIEDLACYMGFETTMAALDEARDLARQYGLDNLLAAMRKAVDVHEWRYVKGILRKGGAIAKPDPETAPTAQDDEVRWV